MNANKLIGMAMNMILRRVMRAGMNKGMDALSKRGKGKGHEGPDAKDAQQRMRQSVRLGRRLGRF
ncbi:MAG: hypothetical protein AAF641_05765 [Pseudomonadota bacterium]